MKLSVTFKEIEDFVRAKTRKSVSLSKSEGANTVRVGYVFERQVPFIGKTISKEVNALVAINGISGLDLDVSYDFGKGLDLIVSGVKMFLGDVIENTNMLSWGKESNQVILHLDEIAEQRGIKIMEKVKKNIEIYHVGVSDDGIEICFSTKEL